MSCPSCGSPSQGGCMCYQNQYNQMQAAQNQMNVYTPYTNTTGGSLSQAVQGAYLGQYNQKPWSPTKIEDFLILSSIDQYWLAFKQAKLSEETFRTLLKLACHLKTIDNLMYLEYLEKIEESKESTSVN